MTDGPPNALLDPWWVELLDPVTSSLELPCGPTGPARTEATARTGELGLLVAGLLTRYLGGPVALTVQNENAADDAAHDRALQPVVVDLSDDPGFDEAQKRWHTALAECAERPVEPGALPAVVGQVVVASTSAPSPVADGATVLVTTDGAVTAHAGSATVLAAHLDALATSWVGDACLFDTPLVDPAELDALPSTHGSERDVEHGTILDLIAAQTAERPGAVAVRDDAHALDYAALERRVSALARVLRARGVGPGTLVGLSVRRSADMLVGLLAILRAGAAYVPIDPDYPDDRVAMMIEDAAMACVVTRAGDRRPSALDGLTQVDVSSTLDPSEATADADPAPPTADDLAYVIFTSGSTGRPKGVMIGHRALRNFIASVLETPGIGADDRLLAVTTVCFDIAGLELFAPLCTGATVVIADENTVADPVALAGRLESAGITVMQATPATWRMLVDFGWQGRNDLTVLCGGEALPLALAEQLAACCQALWNMYGPTETTIWSLTGRVTGGGPITLGEPLANTGVHIVGRLGELLPLGVAGELAISGAGLADGYLGRPDLTAERFVPARWDPALRLYRTGDLVRRDASGAIGFVGRLDNQVKVRGFRIECGEVETALERLAGVSRAAAVVRPEPGTGVNQLVAFVTGADPDAEALRSGLRRTLPDYMVPSVLTVLDAFPMTLNGKIDRGALAALQPHRARTPATAARTPLEQRLTGIWERVFDFEGIGVDDDIFSLGASSLLVARLLAEISRELGVTLPVAVAFEAPTIAGQAALLDAADGVVRPAEHRALVPIRTSGTRTPLFLVHGGAGTVLLYEPLARRLGADQPVYALQAVGLAGDAPVQVSVGGMARRYVRELRSVQATGPYRIGGYCYGALVAFEMARQLDRAGQQVDLLMSFNGPSPSYLRNLAPRFDANGAVLPERREQQTRRKRLRMVLHRAIRDSMLGYSALRRRPMPALLRTGVGFQRLSVLAQRRYFPRKLTGSMLVVSAEGLYESADLGWSAHVDGPVSTFSVPGEQITPRRTMTDTFVEPVVEVVRSRLDALDARDAPDDMDGRPGPAA